ncbi:MAG: DUF4397 domain-containing protein [Pseudomonadota bacterium]
MVPRIFALFLVCAVVILPGLSGCDSDSGGGDDDEENPSRSLRMVNAVSGSVSLGWEIDESDQGTVAFGRASAAQAIIDGTKPLTFYLVQADGDLEFLDDLAFDYELDGDFDVLILLYGTLDAIQVQVIEEEGFDVDEDFGRLGFINLTSAYPSLDLYLTDADEGVFAANPLVFSETTVFSGMVDIEEGDYELQFTRIGEKEIVFDAGDVDIDEDTNHFYLAMDFASGSDSILVLEVQGDGTTRQLVDDDTPARLRFFNAIADYPTVDVFFGDTSGTPVFEMVGFRSMTDYVDVDAGSYNVNITPTGVLDTFFYEAELAVVSGGYSTLVVAGVVQGEDGDPEINGNVIADTVRPIDAGAQVSFVHASPANEAVDVYLLLPGQPVDDATPVISALAPFLSFDFEQQEGDFQITLVQSSNDAQILGPIPVTLEDGDILEIFFSDSEGGGTPGQLTLIRTDLE